jgi:hypothetical protein
LQECFSQDDTKVFDLTRSDALQKALLDIVGESSLIVGKSEKTARPLKRGRDQRRSVQHIIGQDNKPLYLDHPQFEGFEVRQTVGRGRTE